MILFLWIQLITQEIYQISLRLEMKLSLFLNLCLFTYLKIRIQIHYLYHNHQRLFILLMNALQAIVKNCSKITWKIRKTGYLLKTKCLCNALRLLLHLQKRDFDTYQILSHLNMLIQHS